ncbi:MAG: ABC transporter substrate-binding protein [Salinispira sp.]
MRSHFYTGTLPQTYTGKLPQSAKPAAFFVIVGVFFSSMLFAGGGMEEPGVHEPIGGPQAITYPAVVMDDFGNSVSIEQKPQRIASLTLFTDELLFDLVAPDRLAAITYLAADEVYSNVADRAAEVENHLDLNVEAIIELDPDIVFVANWSDAGKVEQLRRAEIPVYLIDTPTTLEDIWEKISYLGWLLDASDSAQNIIARMRNTLGPIRNAVADIPGNERLRAMDYSSWGNSSAAGTTWDTVLEAAGVINAAGGLAGDGYGQAQMSRELIVALNPDVLFLPGWIWGDPEGAAKFEQNVRNDPSLAGINAVENDRIYLVPENLKSTYSQYIAEAVLEVARLVYPEYVK